MNQRDTRIWNTPAVQAEPHGSQRAMKTAVELREKLESAQARLRAIDEERAGRAFDGMLENGASPNRRSLEKLRADGAAVAEEIRDIESAIATAQQRLEDARSRARRSAAEDDARHVLELAESLRAAGVGCADALGSFSIRYSEFRDILTELHKHGYAPRPELARLASERALGSALSPLKLSPTGALQASQRVTMSAIAEQYATSAITQAKRVIGETKEAA